MKTTILLASREKRLRRAAEKKGLYIYKRKWRFNPESETHTGYCVGIAEYGALVWCGDANGYFFPTLEEAEEIVREY